MILSALTAYQLCEGDMKVFSYSTSRFSGSVGFAVIETTDDEVILARAEELLDLLHLPRSYYEVLYLAVVNIVALHSTLLVIGDDEASLAEKAFTSSPGFVSENKQLFSLGKLVSRKKDFIPVISKAINTGGWKPFE